jgi:hypothetical protein
MTKRRSGDPSRKGRDTISSAAAESDSERSKPDYYALSWLRIESFLTGSQFVTLAKITLSAFIIFHLFAVSLWLLPPSPFRTHMLAPFNSYVTMSGLWQSWNVFAPVPKTWNIYLTGDVVYQDGSRTIWQFPRLEKLDYLTRMQKQPYRKWAHEGLVDVANSITWPDAARFIARQTARPGKQPQMVSLVKHWAYIPPPEVGLGKPSPEPNKSYVFYKYIVSAGDLP